MADILHLAPGMAEEVIAHAREGYPEEVCGIIGGKGGHAKTLCRGHNLAPRPREAFDLDTATLARQVAFEDAGDELTAIYHSHPRGPAAPSPADVRRAFYPDAVHVICSLADPARPVLRAFRIVGGVAQEVGLRTAPRGMTDAGSGTALMPLLDLTGEAETARLSGEHDPIRA